MRFATNMRWSFPPTLEEVKVSLALAIPTGESFTLSTTLELPPEQRACTAEARPHRFGAHAETFGGGHRAEIPARPQPEPLRTATSP
jgi:hypothetical protein